MAKIRHISYRAEDVDAIAEFFIDAMGVTLVQKREDGAVDLTDGRSTLRYFRWRRIGAAVPDSTISVFPQRTIRNRSAGWNSQGE